MWLLLSSSSAVRPPAGNTAAPIETFVVHGQPKSYIKTAESGNRRAQLFCPECATPLFAMAPENATSVIIRLGCVTQRAQLTPAVQLWEQSSMPWLPGLGRIPATPKQEGFLPAQSKAAY